MNDQIARQLQTYCEDKFQSKHDVGIRNLENYTTSRFRFRDIVEWLENRRTLVPCQKPSPTHNDFHAGNVLLQDDGSPCDRSD